MQRKKLFMMMVATGFLLVLGTGLWLATAQPVNAQCGSQASSCKNCHEVQAQKSVNSDGTGWHQSHAFGDFCYICHAGNQQATDIAEAHTGMVAPLSDIKASCQQCHPNDLTERAQVYATVLGVDVNASSAPAAPAVSDSTTSVSDQPAAVAPKPVSVAAPANTEIDLNDPNLVDYAKNYDEIVLGKKPINWGNAILLAIIGMVVVGGGGFVITREKLVKVSFGETKKAGDEYPADLVDMLPAIANLKASSRKSLKNVLSNPKKAEKVLGLMDAVVSDEKSSENTGSENGKE
jgi:hypothetical protein